MVNDTVTSWGAALAWLGQEERQSCWKPVGLEETRFISISTSDDGGY